MQERFKFLGLVLFVVGFAGLFFYFINLPMAYAIPLDETLDKAIFANGCRIIENLDGDIAFRDVKKSILYTDSRDFLVAVGENQSIVKTIETTRRSQFSDVVIGSKYSCYLPEGILVEYGFHENRGCSYYADSDGDTRVNDEGILLATDGGATLLAFIFGLAVIAIVAYLIVAIVEWLIGYAPRTYRRIRSKFASKERKPKQ